MFGDLDIVGVVDGVVVVYVGSIDVVDVDVGSVVVVVVCDVVIVVDGDVRVGVVDVGVVVACVMMFIVALILALL